MLCCRTTSTIAVTGPRESTDTRFRKPSTVFSSPNRNFPGLTTSENSFIIIGSEAVWKPVHQQGEDKASAILIHITLWACGKVNLCGIPLFCRFSWKKIHVKIFSRKTNVMEIFMGYKPASFRPPLLSSNEVIFTAKITDTGSERYPLFFINGTYSLLDQTTVLHTFCLLDPDPHSEYRSGFMYWQISMKMFESRNCLNLSVVSYKHQPKFML